MRSEVLALRGFSDFGRRGILKFWGVLRFRVWVSRGQRFKVGFHNALGYEGLAFVVQGLGATWCRVCLVGICVCPCCVRG